jgi:HAD superfamily hydrolase (TIGR01509 family)
MSTADATSTAATDATSTGVAPDVPAPVDPRFADAFGSWTPRAVVFDCDGLLLDTESVWERTQARLLEEFGGALTPELKAQGHGVTIEVAAQMIADACGVSYDLVLPRTRERFAHDVGEDVTVKPGAREVLEATSARVPIACASNSWYTLLQDKLGVAGLLDMFTAVEAADTVTRGKPFPDIYLAGVRDLGVAPADALAFEDSPVGAQAARDAGLRLITVPEEGEPPEADLALTTLVDAGLLDWIATW